MVDSKLCLIDANSLFYRAFFAIKSGLITSSGQPTNAVFGFVKMVNRIIEELNPQYLAVCFDVSKNTHRRQKFSEYKIHRAAMPDALVSQLPYIKEVVAAYNFPVFELEGFEADDVIATMAHKLAEKVTKVVIISSDKDILQLVGGNIEVYNPYKEEGIVFTKEVVKERFGVEPERIKDLISLMGDSSDNIPGAKGIGEKTARALLQEFKDAEDIIKNSDKIKRLSVRAIVEQNSENIRLSKDLATLINDVPLNIELDNVKVKPADTEKLWDIFSRLEFKGMLKTLSEERLCAPGNPSLDISKKQISNILEIIKEIKNVGSFAFFINEEELSAGVLKVNIAFDKEKVFETGDVDFLKALFSLSGCLIVGCDIKHSKHVLRRYGIELGENIFDVMIAAYLIESLRSGFELESLLWEYLSLKHLSRLDYLGKEAHFLFALKDVMLKRLKEEALLKLFNDVEIPLLSVLFEMEETGVSIDTDFLKNLSVELEKRLDKIVSSIYELAGSPFNINSPKQLSDILFNKLKLPPVKKTKTGFSTDEEVLTKLALNNELPKILLEYRQITKLKTTYVDALPNILNKETGKIHSSFNQAGTETGRLSSSSPNLQNIPIKTEIGRSIRRAFIPSKGFDLLVSVDYSQIELRMLAHLSEDENLKKAFYEGCDIHKHTASLIFSVDEKDVTDEMRNNSKRVNFGIIYGMSSYGLAKDLGVDAATAENFISEYFLRYPKVKEYLDSQVEFVKSNGYTATILGRRRYIPEIKNSNFAIRQFAERQAINAPIQGSAADLIKLAMIDVYNKLKGQSSKSRLILQVHDELVFEVKKGEEDNLVSLVRKSMESVLKLNVPLKVTVYVGKNWLDMEAL